MSVSDTVTRRVERLPRSQALDGLRGVAAILVVSYHAARELTPGGWSGVNLFFVLSGFLITHLLLVEQANTGSIDIIRFWKRRAIRLIPPVTAVLGVYLTFVTVIWFINGTGNLADSFRTAFAAQIYVVNWVFALGQPRDGAIGHLWSLSVEEQFYLVWPVILLLLLAKARRFLPSFLALGITVSFLVPVFADWTPARLYFGSEIHVAELLLGAGIALAHVSGRLNSPELRKRPARIVTQVAVAILVLVVLVVPFQTPLSVTPLFLVVFAASCVVVIVNLVVDTEGPLAALLSTRVLVALGQRSYSLYLAHHPIEQGLRSLPWAGQPVLHLITTVAVSLVATELLYRFVEVKALGRKPKPKPHEDAETSVVLT